MRSYQQRKKQETEQIRVYRAITNTVLFALAILTFFVIFGIVGRMDREFNLAQQGYNQNQIGEILK